MVQEVGIISWLIYFLLDNKSLSVYTETSNKQNLSLAFKAKLHSSIVSTINNSKRLNSIIARALDEISEEINLTNNLASIIIDDSILSHSLIVKSKKYENIDQQIIKESQLKWGDNYKNYYIDNIYNCIWQDGLNMNDENVLQKVLKNLNVNPKTFFLRAASTSIKESLRKKTNDAFERGVFGAPSFVSNNKVFWGQDRIEFVCKEASK